MEISAREMGLATTRQGGAAKEARDLVPSFEPPVPCAARELATTTMSDGRPTGEPRVLSRAAKKCEVPPVARADHARLYEIDLLRFIAALSVLLFHYSFRGFARGNLTTMQYPEVWPLAHYGYLGVNLFFIISGFVILMSAVGSTPKRFIISRVVRLYPAFWVCCLLTFAATVLIGGPRFVTPVKRVLVNLTMMPGFFNVPAVDGVYWSLAVELKFYFLILALLLLKQMRCIKAYLVAWLVAAIVVGPLQVSFVPLRYAAHFIIPDFAPYFIAGATFYLAFKEGWSPFTSGLVAASFGLAIFQAVREAGQASAFVGVTINHYVVAGFICAFFAVFALIASRKLKAISTPKYLLLGALTYPLYLVHQYVGYMIFNGLNERLNRHALFWGTTFLMLFVAWLVNRFVERPFANPFRSVLQRVLPGE
jgi:peptidoglycan/LPS O-acetylase OafA/YrhL